MSRSHKCQLPAATIVMVSLVVAGFALLQIAPRKTTEFKPPVADQDWVLVLGAALKELPAPGRKP